jgi:hypothetical protein
MTRQAIRGLVLFGAVVALVHSARAQNIPDKVSVRSRTDGSVKEHSGTFTLSPAGFQVIGADKKTVVATVNPDDVVKVSIGDLPGIDRQKINSANTKEFPTDAKQARDYDGARLIYEELKKGKLAENSRRYVEFKVAALNNKIVDEIDFDKGWAAKADDCIKLWIGFLATDDTKFGWEQWPAARACTRLQIERGKFDDAAITWNRVVKNTNAPADARIEAGIQEIDLRIRAGGAGYASASLASAELLKTAAGVKKDRLVIYEIAARAGSEGKHLEGVDKIKAEMNKTKDAAVHATGFGMMGELYLAGGKPRDAMWMFLWVETVVNQDKDEAFKALARLADLFQKQADEDQEKKYRDKLKRFRANF